MQSTGPELTSGQSAAMVEASTSRALPWGCEEEEIGAGPARTAKTIIKATPNTSNALFAGSLRRWLIGPEYIARLCRLEPGRAIGFLQRQERRFRIGPVSIGGSGAKAEEGAFLTAIEFAVRA